jgi:hypothetical protein
MYHDPEVLRHTLSIYTSQIYPSGRMRLHVTPLFGIVLLCYYFYHCIFNTQVYIYHDEEHCQVVLCSLLTNFTQLGKIFDCY